MQIDLRSNRGTTFVVKFWAPLISVFGVLGVFGKDFPS